MTYEEQLAELGHFENCQYCGLSVTPVKRQIYGTDDWVWMCPECESTVTKIRKEEAPSGFVATAPIRKARKEVYSFCFDATDTNFLYKEYLIQTYGTTKITSLTDEEILSCASFMNNLHSQVTNEIKDDELQLLRRELLLRERNLYHRQAKFIFSCLPEEVKEALLRNKRSTKRIKSLLEHEEHPITELLRKKEPSNGV